MTGISQKMCFRMRKEISEKINRMPLEYFESRTVGEVLSRITNDVDTLGMSLNQSVTQLITSVTTIIGITDHDAQYQSVDDIDRYCHFAGIDDLNYNCCQILSEILPDTAGIFGSYQRPGGRGLQRPEYC